MVRPRVQLEVRLEETEVQLEVTEVRLEETEVRQEVRLEVRGRVLTVDFEKVRAVYLCSHCGLCRRGSRRQKLRKRKVDEVRGKEKE